MLDFDLRQLEYFVTAVKTGSFSAAAKELYVSAQAISKGIYVLEGRIGVTLFDRSANGITLTAFGSEFYKECLQVFNAIASLQKLTDSHRLSSTPSLAVGIHRLCLKENGGSLDWDTLRAFQDAHSDIIVSFSEVSGDDIIELLKANSIDFGITVAPTDSQFNNDFESILLRVFPLAALVAENSALHTRSGSITIEELSQHGRLVSFFNEHGFNDVLISKAQAEGAKIQLSTLFINPEHDMEYVIENDLFAIRPIQHAERTIRPGSIRIQPVVDELSRPVEMPLHLIWKRDRNLSDEDTAFIELVRSRYRNSSH